MKAVAKLVFSFHLQSLSGGKPDSLTEFNQQLKPKAAADPFLYGGNADSWNAAEKQLIPKPEPAVLAPLEFKQDTSLELTDNQDAISIPTAEPLTPTKNPVTAKREKPSPSKSKGKEVKPVINKPDQVTPTKSKLQQPAPKEDTVSIPAGEPLTPKHSLAKQKVLEPDAASIPPAEPSTPLKAKLSPAKKTQPTQPQATTKAPGQPIASKLSPRKDVPAIVPKPITEETVSIPPAEGSTPRHVPSKPAQPDTISVPGAEPATPQKTKLSPAKKASNSKPVNNNIKGAVAKPGLDTNITKDPFLFEDSNAAASKTVQNQQISKPEQPVEIAEFKQEEPPVDDDAISIPDGEPETPRKQLDTKQGKEAQGNKPDIKVAGKTNKQPVNPKKSNVNKPNNNNGTAIPLPKENPYKHQSRNAPPPVKPQIRKGPKKYGIGISMQKDEEERLNAELPQGRVISFGHMSPPETPFKNVKEPELRLDTKQEKTTPVVKPMPAPKQKSTLSENPKAAPKQKSTLSNKPLAVPKEKSDVGEKHAAPLKQKSTIEKQPATGPRTPRGKVAGAPSPPVARKPTNQVRCCSFLSFSFVIFVLH